MPDVSFYHVTRSSVEDALARLMEKALGAGLKVAVSVPDEQRVAALDAHLWTYEPASFLPHGTARNDHADLQPIFIGIPQAHAAGWPNTPQVLAVLDNALPDEVSGFQRALYLFAGDNPLQLETARSHWSALKAKDMSLTYWQQTDSGGWTKKASS